MLKVVIGHSNDPESEFAIAEVIEQCQADLAGDVPIAGVLLAAIDFNHPQLLQEIQQAFPAIELIGGTTDGEFSSVLGFQQDSLLLILFCSDTIVIRAGIGRAISENPEAAVDQAVKQAAFDSSVSRLCLTIAEGLTINGDATLTALRQCLSNDTTIAGGLTGDHGRYQQTYQFFQTEVVSDAICILLFFGELHLSTGVSSGWQPIGKAGKITKSHKGVVHEIDNQPALAFYQRYLGNLLPSTDYPLAVFPSGSQKFYIRALNHLEQTTGSIYFSGNVPEQSVVQIAEVTQKSLLSATETSVREALAAYPGESPSFVFCFPCDSRRHLLGTQTKREYHIVQTILPTSLPSVGFYCYGEIAPLEKNSSEFLHHQSFVTLLMGTN